MLAPGDAELRCQADGRPVPEIVWIRNLDDQFTQTADNVDITEAIDGLNKTSILTIQRTTPEDTATYSCRAQNLVSSETSTGVQVDIFGKLLQQICKWCLVLPVF
ncbi:MAG: immunoglobulin domain-containing protein [Proteobacteria bacterium]|nr:immunoglobulin domain-containing protein [Pseudomonadota bacterium]